MTNPKKGGRATEFADVTIYSLLVGIVIGSVQHTLGFLRTAGELGLAGLVGFSIFEGGFVGGAFGVITGWICYYAIFERRASRKEWVLVVAYVAMAAIFIGLIVGFLVPDALFVSALAMPGITVGIAAVVARRQQRTQPQTKLL